MEDLALAQAVARHATELGSQPDREFRLVTERVVQLHDQIPVTVSAAGGKLSPVLADQRIAALFGSAKSSEDVKTIFNDIFKRATRELVQQAQGSPHVPLAESPAFRAVEEIRDRQAEQQGIQEAEVAIQESEFVVSSVDDAAEQAEETVAAEVEHSQQVIVPDSPKDQDQNVDAEEAIMVPKDQADAHKKLEELEETLHPEDQEKPDQEKLELEQEQEEINESDLKQEQELEQDQEQDQEEDQGQKEDQEELEQEVEEALDEVTGQTSASLENSPAMSPEESAASPEELPEPVPESPEPKQEQSPEPQESAAASSTASPESAAPSPRIKRERERTPEDIGRSSAEPEDSKRRLRSDDTTASDTKRRRITKKRRPTPRALAWAADFCTEQGPGYELEDPEVVINVQEPGDLEERIHDDEIESSQDLVIEILKTFADHTMANSDPGELEIPLEDVDKWARQLRAFT